MLQYIIKSVVLGLLPETLFFTLILICAKNLKNKKKRLFVLIGFSYFIFILLYNYKMVNYVIFIILTYAVLKLLYKDKTQKIDIFVINIAFMYICLISFLCFSFVNTNTDYYIMMIIDRILLFIPFIYRKRMNEWYNMYCNLWNRNDKENRPIKSITLRNISLISLNAFIFMSNVVFLYISNLKG